MLNTWEEAEAAADLFSTLDQLGTVYTESVTTGRYTTVVKTFLECRLVPLVGNAGMRFAPTSGDRAEDMAFRFLYWRPDYAMPEQCQVEIEAIRYQVEAGTFQTLRAGSSGVLIRRCSVLRVQVSSF